jgi:hypothetical protein
LLKQKEDARYLFEHRVRCAMLEEREKRKMNATPQPGQSPPRHVCRYDVPLSPTLYTPSHSSAFLSHHRSNLIHGIQILIQYLVHGKHVDAILLEDGAHGVVAANLALVGRVLQVALLDVFPYFLDGLGARELGFAEEGGEGGGEGHWFLGTSKLGFGFLRGGIEGDGGRTWNPPFLLGLFFSAPLPDAMSLSSSSLTRLELFFLVFFLGSGARFLVFPPRVERIREFSSCCNRRA